jgi:hypothetical protein
MNLQSILNTPTLSSKAYSFLFSGPNTSDKVQAAKQLVKALLSSDAHPNLLWLDSKQKISVDEVRAIQAIASKTTYDNLPCVVVIESVEHLSLSAANALLKTIEEPVHQCYFILTTACATSVLATIRSRCITIKFGHAVLDASSPDGEQLCYLAERMDMPVDALVSHQALAFYNELLVAVQAYKTRPQATYKFIDNNFNKDTNKWPIFKVLIRHVVTQLVKAVNGHDLESPIPNEVRLLQDIAVGHTTQSLAELYTLACKLVYNTDKLNLSAAQVVLVLVCKVGRIVIPEVRRPAL